MFLLIPPFKSIVIESTSGNVNLFAFGLVVTIEYCIHFIFPLLELLIGTLSMEGRKFRTDGVVAIVTPLIFVKHDPANSLEIKE